MKQIPPVQLGNLVRDTVNASMNGNAGLATVRLRKALELPQGSTLDLNKKILEIELQARKDINAAIRTFIDSQKTAQP